MDDEQFKAINGVARRYLAQKGFFSFYQIGTTSMFRGFEFFTYTWDKRLNYPRGIRRFRNILPGLFKRLKRTAKACGYTGEFRIYRDFARMALNIEAPLEGSLDYLKNIVEWNMKV